MSPRAQVSRPKRMITILSYRRFSKYAIFAMACATLPQLTRASRYDEMDYVEMEKLAFGKLGISYDAQHAGYLRLEGNYKSKTQSGWYPATYGGINMETSTKRNELWIDIVWDDIPTKLMKCQLNKDLVKILSNDTIPTPRYEYIVNSKVMEIRYDRRKSQARKQPKKDSSARFKRDMKEVRREQEEIQLRHAIAESQKVYEDVHVSKDAKYVSPAEKETVAPVSGDVWSDSDDSQACQAWDSDSDDDNKEDEEGRPGPGELFLALEFDSLKDANIFYDERIKPLFNGFNGFTFLDDLDAFIRATTEGVIEENSSSRISPEALYTVLKERVRGLLSAFQARD